MTHGRVRNPIIEEPTWPPMHAKDTTDGNFNLRGKLDRLIRLNLNRIRINEKVIKQRNEQSVLDGGKRLPFPAWLLLSIAKVERLRYTIY